MVEIVHAGAAEVPVGGRKPCRFDNVGSHVQACAQAQNRSGVLWDIGLEKRNLHGVAAYEVLMKCLNKTSLGGDLVHCTFASR
jgi:hypothetical protein